MWILEGIGIVLAVWFFMLFLDWIGGIGQHLTPDQARRRTLRWLEQRQRNESTEEKP